MDLFRKSQAKKSWILPGKAGPSSANPNCFGHKTRLVSHTYSINSLNHKKQLTLTITIEITWMGSFVTPAVLSRPGSIRLPPFCIDVALVYRAALPRFWRSSKTGRWTVNTKENLLFREMEMGKIYRIKWPTLLINKL